MRGDAHEEVDAVSQQQDQQHHELLHDRNIGTHTNGQLVEDHRQNTTRKADGEQTDVRQQIAHQPRHIIIGIPDTESEVHEDILARRSEEGEGHRTGFPTAVGRAHGAVRLHGFPVG